MCHAEEQVKRKASVIREQETLLQVTYQLYKYQKATIFGYFVKFRGEHGARCG